MAATNLRKRIEAEHLKNWHCEHETLLHGGQRLVELRQASELQNFSCQ